MLISGIRTPFVVLEVFNQLYKILILISFSLYFRFYFLKLTNCSRFCRKRYISLSAKKIFDIVQHLSNLRENFDFVWNKCNHAEEEEELGLPRKIMRIEATPRESRNSSYKRLFFEIIDVVKFNIQQRFQELPKLRFISLLDSRRFKDFQKQFPETEFSCLKENYGVFFCLESLKSELIVVSRW